MQILATPLVWGIEVIKRTVEKTVVRKNNFSLIMSHFVALI